MLSFRDSRVRLCSAVASANASPAFEVPRHLIQIEQPHDCGAPRPPTGISGIEFWLQHDPAVFANVYGVGGSVLRPSVLWE